MLTSRCIVQLTADRSMFQKSALQTRDELYRVTQGYDSLVSRYNALLAEVQKKSPRPEVDDSADYESENKPITTDNDTSPIDDGECGQSGLHTYFALHLKGLSSMSHNIAMLRKERDAFRKARDTASQQRLAALEQLSAADAENKRLTASINSLKNTCNLLQQRIRYYCSRCDIMDKIIGHQRNHILSHNGAMEPLAEEAALAAMQTPLTNQSAASAVTVTPGLAAMMRHAVPGHPLPGMPNVGERMPLKPVNPIQATPLQHPLPSDDQPAPADRPLNAAVPRFGHGIREVSNELPVFPLRAHVSDSLRAAEAARYVLMCHQLAMVGQVDRYCLVRKKNLLMRSSLQGWHTPWRSLW